MAKPPSAQRTELVLSELAEQRAAMAGRTTDGR